MPSRAYTGIDFIDYSNGVNYNAGSIAAGHTFFSQMSELVNANGGASDAGHNSCTAAVTVNCEFYILTELDFSSFPTIPDDSFISEVELRFDYIYSLSGNSSAAGQVNDSRNSDGSRLNVKVGSGGLQTTLVLVQNDFNEQIIGGGSSSMSASIADAYSVPHTFDFSSAPISKAELISRFGQWIVEFQINSQSWAGAFHDGTGDDGSISTSASLDVSMRLSGVQIQVTYGDAPIAIAVATPASGDLQPGQIITVSSDPNNPDNPDPEDPNYPDNVEPYDPNEEYTPFDPLAINLIDIEYVAITESGRIIPLIIQIINPYTVIIQIPPPSTQPCLDCIPDCPECVAAFAPCDEDLESDDCIAAMDECLDCLIECLEDLQEAEECNESTGQPPEVPVVVVIYCYGGTQFNGRVPLGTFTILYANGSGLYRFTTGKKHDTLYHGDRDGTTYNVKIPDPGGKTGFFRS